MDAPDLQELLLEAEQLALRLLATALEDLLLQIFDPVRERIDDREIAINDRVEDRVHQETNAPVSEPDSIRAPPIARRIELRD